jgi:catabolite regulation protein CreA
LHGLIGRKLILGALAACLVVGSGAAVAEEVGKVGVDWLGNDIIVEAIKDPKVEGVTCHVSYFDRGVIDASRNKTIADRPCLRRCTGRRKSPAWTVRKTLS